MDHDPFADGLPIKNAGFQYGKLWVYQRVIDIDHSHSLQKSTFINPHELILADINLP